MADTDAEQRTHLEQAGLTGLWDVLHGLELSCLVYQHLLERHGEQWAAHEDSYERLSLMASIVGVLESLGQHKDAEALKQRWTILR